MGSSKMAMPAKIQCGSPAVALWNPNSLFLNSFFLDCFRFKSAVCRIMRLELRWIFSFFSWGPQCALLGTSWTMKKLNKQGNHGKSLNNKEWTYWKTMKQVTLKNHWAYCILPDVWWLSLKCTLWKWWLYPSSSDIVPGATWPGMPGLGRFAVADHRMRKMTGVIASPKHRPSSST